MSKNFIKLLSTLLLVALFASLVPSAFAANDILIGIPDDATNGGRAIKLLESVGLIEVDSAAGWTPELKDVTKYLYNVEIMPTQANTLPATLDDFGASTINGTYAIPTGLVPSKDGLAIESQASATTEDGNPFVNVVVARTADKDNELYKTIQTAFQSDIVGQYLIAKYSEAFIPAFDYKDTDKSNDELLALIDGYKADKADKLTFDPDKRKRLDMYPEVQRIFKDYTVYIGGSTSFDFSEKQYNKYDAIMRYAREHGYKKDEILFVGDDFTDGGGDSHVRLGGLDYIQIYDYRTFPQRMKFLYE